MGLASQVDISTRSNGLNHLDLWIGSFAVMDWIICICKCHVLKFQSAIIKRYLKILQNIEFDLSHELISITQVDLAPNA